MKLFEKEIIYKLQSLGLEIFKNNLNEEFLIMKHVCSDCHESWFTNKEQCIFCGSLGFNVKICEKMHISLIAGKKETCGINGCEIPEKDLEKSCINPDCSSNKNKKLKAIIKKLTASKSKGTGIFSTNSPFCISQSNCFFCGCSINEFMSKELDIKIIEEDNQLESIQSNFKKDILIVKSKKGYLTQIQNEDIENKFINNIDIKKILNLFI